MFLALYNRWLFPCIALCAMLLFWPAAPLLACQPTPIPPGLQPPTPIPISELVAGVAARAPLIVEGQWEGKPTEATGSFRVTRYLRGNGPATLVGVPLFIGSCGIPIPAGFYFLIPNDAQTTQRYTVVTAMDARPSTLEAIIAATGEKPRPPQRPLAKLLLPGIGAGLVGLVLVWRLRAKNPAV